MNPEPTSGALPLREKAALTTGANYWLTPAAPAIGLPAIRMADGPHGLRVQDHQNPDHLGIGRSARATCFPPAVTLASSWDLALIEQVGAALGRAPLALQLGVPHPRAPHPRGRGHLGRPPSAPRASRRGAGSRRSLAML